VEDEKILEFEKESATMEQTAGELHHLRRDLEERVATFVSARLDPFRHEIQQTQSRLQELQEGLSRAHVETMEELGPLWQAFEDAIRRATSDQQASLQSRLEAAIVEERQRTGERLAALEERLKSSQDALARTLQSLPASFPVPVERGHAAEAQLLSEPQETKPFVRLQEAVESISLKTSQQEALSSLMDCVTAYAPRAIFFVIRAGKLIGWRARGFENGLTDATVMNLSGTTEQASLLGESLRKLDAVELTQPEASQLQNVLGPHLAPLPRVAMAVPLVVREKAVAILYVDNGGSGDEGGIEREAIAMLLQVTALSIELLSMRKQVGLTAAKPVTSPPPETLRNAPPIPAEPPQVSPTVRADTPLPPSAAIEPPQPAKVLDREELPTVERAPQVSLTSPMESSPASESPASESSPVEQLPQLEAKTEPPPALTVEPDPPLAQEDGEKEADRKEIVSSFQLGSEMGRITREIPAGDHFPISAPSEEERPEEEVRVIFPLTQDRTNSLPDPANWKWTTKSIQEPSRVTELSLPASEAPPSPSEEVEQRSHNDARRFARLLVSEIKLYYAAKVNEGRRNFDLYTRLTPEIERNRQVYDKRVSPEVAMKVDYFHEELVQTLAEGDPAKLGDNYPGPSRR
jgi:hypothetical protein